MDKWKDDIEKYINGKLTPAERHALEKRALSDPFLADALEGAEALHPHEFGADLAELNRKIGGAGKSQWVWPLRIAASIVGVALVSTVVFYSIRDDETQLANSQKQTETKAAEEAKPATTDTTLVAGNKSEKDETADTENKVKEKPKTEELLALRSLKEERKAGAEGSGLLSSKPSTSQPTTGPTELKNDSISLSGSVGYFSLSSKDFKDSIVRSAEAEVADDVVASPPTVQPIIAKTESLSSGGARARKSLQETSATASQPKFENIIVNGEVHDQQGQPIPGVNILVKGTSNGTVTNAEGKYSIALSQPDQTLQYSFIGYVAQEQKADKAKAGDLDVQLQEDATQLSEVVVTGYADRSSNNSGEPIVRLAEPVGGRKAYDDYLENKKMYPQQAIENKIEGKVIIEFTVSTTGLVSDFTVVKKIGYGCEDEVIRLVREGPKWYPSYIDNEAVESTVRVKTRFDLPGKK
jgi:TonB family protein